MQLFKLQKCPCCQTVITPNEFFEREQTAEKPEYDKESMVLFKCPHCDKVIIGIRERATITSTIFLGMVIFIMLSAWYLYPNLVMIIYFGVGITIFALLASLILPYLLVKPKCYNVTEIRDLENESEMHHGILAVTVFLFFAMIFALFYNMTREYKGLHPKIDKVLDVKKHIKENL